MHNFYKLNEINKMFTKKFNVYSSGVRDIKGKKGIPLFAAENQQ